MLSCGFKRALSFALFVAASFMLVAAPGAAQSFEWEGTHSGRAFVITRSGSELWIGSTNGAVTRLRIDDGSSETFHPINTPALDSGAALDLAVDAEGHVWAVTLGGLAHFDGEAWTAVEHDNFGFGSVPGRSEQFERAIEAVAHGPDGRTWVATYLGVAVYDGTTWTAFDHEDMGLPPEAGGDLFISDIASDAAGTLWVGTRVYGLWSYNEATGWKRIEALRSPTLSGFVSAVHARPGGGVWVGFEEILDRPRALAYFDGDTWEVYQGDVPSSHILGVETEGSVWVGGSTLFRFDRERWTSRTVCKPAQGWGFNDVEIEEAGALWVPCPSGITRYAEGTETYITGPPAGKIVDLVSAPDGLVWIAIQGADGVSLFDGKRWRTVTSEDVGVRSEQASSGLSASQVAVGSNGHVAVAFDGVLARYDGVSVSWITADGQEPPDPSVPLEDYAAGPIEKVVALAVDAKGGAWAAEEAGTRLLYLRPDGVLTEIALPGEEWPWPPADVSSLAVGPEGDLWAGTVAAELFRYDGERWELVDPNLQDVLAADRITALVFDADGALWIGSHGGLARYQGGVVTAMTTGEEEPPPPVWFVEGLAADPRGGMWVHGWQGLAYFDGSTWHVAEDPLGGTSLSSVRALTVDASGRAWVGLYGNVYTLRFGERPTATEPPARPATTTYLEEAYPNPFRNAARIVFTLPEPMPVHLRVYDMLGREVAVLAEGPHASGQHAVTFDAGGYANGLYMYRLVTPRGVETGRVMRVR